MKKKKLKQTPHLSFFCKKRQIFLFQWNSVHSLGLAKTRAASTLSQTEDTGTLQNETHWERSTSLPLGSAAACYKGSWWKRSFIQPTFPRLKKRVQLWFAENPSTHRSLRATDAPLPFSLEFPPTLKQSAPLEKLPFSFSSPPPRSWPPPPAGTGAEALTSLRAGSALCRPRSGLGYRRRRKAPGFWYLIPALPPCPSPSPNPNPGLPTPGQGSGRNTGTPATTSVAEGSGATLAPGRAWFPQWRRKIGSKPVRESLRLWNRARGCEETRGVQPPRNLSSAPLCAHRDGTLPNYAAGIAAAQPLPHSAQGQP